MTCERVDAPGRVRCEVEARVGRGRGITWGDVVITKTPAFVGALRGRIGPHDATTHERRGVAVGARARGEGEGAAATSRGACASSCAGGQVRAARGAGEREGRRRGVPKTWPPPAACGVMGRGCSSPGASRPRRSATCWARSTASRRRGRWSSSRTAVALTGCTSRSGLVVAVEIDGAAPSLAEILRRDRAADDDVLRRSLLRAMASRRLHGEVLVDEFRLPVRRRRRAAAADARPPPALEQLARRARLFRVAVRPPAARSEAPLDAARVPPRIAGARAIAARLLRTPSRGRRRAGACGRAPGLGPESAAPTGGSPAPCTPICTPRERRGAPRPRGPLPRITEAYRPSWSDAAQGVGRRRPSSPPGPSSGPSQTCVGSTSRSPPRSPRRTDES